MSKVIINLLEKFQAETPSLSNQHNRLSLIGVLPIQANSSFTKDQLNTLTNEKKDIYWAQLLCNYSSSYNRTDENGQVHDDNASLKTLVIKFPMDYLKSQAVSTQQFKTFFDKNYVGKAWLILPVSEEKGSSTWKDKKSVPIKNQTEVTIDSSFNLKEFMGLASEKK